MMQTLAIPLMALLAALSLAACDKSAREEASAPLFARVNAPAPDFTLARYGADGSVKLSDYRGKIVLVNFWASWCPPCKVEMPDLVSLAKDYEHRDLVVLGVVVGSEPAQIDSVIAAFGIPYHVAVGTDDVARTYGVSGIPATYIIDREGVIRTSYEGARSRSTFERDVVRLLGS